MQCNNNNNYNIFEHVIIFSVEDIWPNLDRRDGEEEPDWVKDERSYFNKHKDKDGDGKLNKVSPSFINPCSTYID